MIWSKHHLPSFFVDDFQTNVSLEDVDPHDTTFRVTTNTNNDELVRSISTIGLLNPLILKKKEDSTFCIISGFRRIQSCLETGLKKIPARIVKPDISYLDCAILSIADNAFDRQLNIIEQSRAFEMLFASSEKVQVVAKIAVSLNLPGNPSHIKKIRSISNLPASIQNFILDDTISLTIALELSCLENNISEAFGNLFNDLKLSLSKQKEILTLTKEISIRENVPIIRILEGSDIQNIITDHDIDRNRKTGKIRKLLSAKRFPELTKAENKYYEKLNTIELGAGVKLVPPKNFEGTDYLLTFTFNSVKELNERKKSFNKLVDNPIIKNILDR